VLEQTNGLTVVYLPRRTKWGAAWEVFKLALKLTPMEVEFVINGLKQLREISSGAGAELAATLQEQNAGIKPFNPNDKIKVAEYRVRPEDT
jgi:hypothetical protein